MKMDKINELNKKIRNFLEKKQNKKLFLIILLGAVGILFISLSELVPPDSEEIELEEGMLIIDDEDVPLADGPGGPGASPAPSEQPTAQITVDKNLQRLVDLVNQERAKAGLAPLTMVEETNTAAGIRAKEIYNKFAHERPDGSKYRSP